MDTFPSDAGGDGGLPAGCTETCTSSKLSEMCTSTTAGYTTTSSTVFTYSGTGWTGTITETTTGPDGGVFLMCTYDATATKD
jgi:hypothetical protein